jgi:Tfp pilus assembly protein PilX
MKNQSTTLLRDDYFSRGFSLMPCVVLITVLALITLTTLRFSYDFQLFTKGRIDRLIAKEAAEIALQDAYAHLKTSDDPLSVSGNEVIYEYGSVTGDTFPFGGRMQSIKPPEYQINVIRTNPSEGISRVTATGFGVFSTTQFIAQMDYAIRLCPDELSTTCEREVRPLAWREQIHE